MLMYKKNVWLYTGDKGDTGAKGIQGEIGPQVSLFIFEFMQIFIVLKSRDSKVILVKKEIQVLSDQKEVLLNYFYCLIIFVH
jgi:hypothetical protein